MKFFQKLLLAPAVAGLFSPIAANASEANLKGVTHYSKSDIQINQDSFKPLSTKNPLLAGGEGLNHDHSDDFDADSFSSTTSASFSSNWAIGAVEGLTAEEKVGVAWDYQIDLTTSFTGNDSLDVTMKAGSGSLSELDLNGNGSGLIVEGIGYTTTLGERLTVFFGDSLAGSSLYNTACVYGGQTDALDDCGNLNSALDLEIGTSAGASFDLGSGFTAALGYEGEGNSSKGILTDEGLDAFGGQLAYTNDSFGVSVTWASVENADLAGVTTSTGLNAYYTPEIVNFPSLSVGFETNHDDTATSDDDDSSHYFVGLQWDELGNGTFGAALGSKAPYNENADAEVMYEAFYSYNYADGMTITPIVYVKENATDNVEDETGIILKTTFSF